MGLKELKAKLVFLDTAPLNYFIEGNTPNPPRLSILFSSHENDEFTFMTSTLILMEVLVQPMKLRNLDLVEQYRQILTNH